VNYFFSILCLFPTAVLVQILQEGTYRPRKLFQANQDKNEQRKKMALADHRKPTADIAPTPADGEDLTAQARSSGSGAQAR